MDLLLERMAAIAERFAKPVHILLAAMIVTGALLFDVLGISSRLGIVAKVTEFRLWFALAFLTSTALVLIVFIAMIFRRVREFTKETSLQRSAFRTILSDEAEVILSLLEVRRPEYVDLLSSHPAVRELRRNGFVEMSMFISSGALQSYGLTKSGKVRAARAKFLSPSENNHIFIESTVRAATADPEASGYSWMAR